MFIYFLQGFSVSNIHLLVHEDFRKLSFPKNIPKGMIMEREWKILLVFLYSVSVVNFKKNNFFFLSNFVIF